MTDNLKWQFVPFLLAAIFLGVLSSCGNGDRMPDIAADTSSTSTALMATTQLTSTTTTTTTTTTTIPPKPSPILCEDWQRATPARWISRQGRWLQQCVRKTAEEMGISCSSNQRLSWNETGKTWRCRSLTPYEQADRDCAESPRITINGERSNHNSEGKCLMLVCDRPKGRTSGYISNYACVSRAWDSYEDSYWHDRSSKITETEARAMEFQSASGTIRDLNKKFSRCEYRLLTSTSRITEYDGIAYYCHVN